MAENYFQELYDIDVSEKIEEKNGLSYLPWSCAWAEVKKIHPDAQYTIYENEIGRPWFDDGRTAWVKTGVTINGIEHIEYLPVMNLRNNSIDASEVKSTDANKTIQRSITKACARHGIGLFVFEGEDTPEVVTKLMEVNDVNFKLAVEISNISDAKKQAVGELLDKYIESHDPRKIEDIDTANEIYKELMKLKKSKK